MTNSNPNSVSELAHNPKNLLHRGELNLNLLDLVEFFIRWKRFIFWNAIIWSLLAIGIVLILPETFIGTVVLMPPEDRSEGISKMMRNIPLTKLAGGASLLSGMQGGKDLENVYLAILSSRKLRLEMIKEFDIIHLYKFDKHKKYFIEDVLKALDKKISINISDEGTFIISVEDKNPQRAAQMANFMASKLNEIYQSLTTDTQRNQRIFLGERLDLIKKDLESSENALSDFQKRNKVLDIEEQAKMTIDAGSDIDTRYLASELNLNILRKIYSPENPKLLQQEMELKQLRNQKESFSSQRKSDLLIPYKLAPTIWLDFIRLKRNLKVQETLFELITQQYEYSKIEESKNTPTIQILDNAEPPQKRASPKRGKTVISVFCVSILFAASYGAFIESISRFAKNNPVEFRRLMEIKNKIFSWKFLLS